jgi:hypothetical protein
MPEIVTKKVLKIRDMQLRTKCLCIVLPASLNTMWSNANKKASRNGITDLQISRAWKPEPKRHSKRNPTREKNTLNIKIVSEEP